MQLNELANDLPVDDPVSMWIDDLKNADDLAAEKLWNHFFLRLYESARIKLRKTTQPVYNEEDAVLSAFQSFCFGLADGRFPDLNDRNGLWRLLLVITSRKISRRHKYDHRERRNVDRNLTNHVFSNARMNESQNDLTLQLVAREPTPEFAAEFSETCDSLFQSLDDPKLQQVVLLRMEGCTNDEIAGQLNCSRRTVQRCLEVIRRQWKRMEVSDE